MKFLKFLSLICSLTIILNSCSGLSDAGKVLRNEKKVSTDEFLVKKKEPLIQPPNFKTIPKPGSAENRLETKKSNIEKILKNSNKKLSPSQSKSTSIENSNLNQIKK